MKKRLLFLLICILSISAYAQERQLTGVVVDATGDPLIGASVGVVGTKIGTLSDTDGKFELSLSSQIKSVKVSYVGFHTQEVNIEKTNSIRIVMVETAEGKALNEVVVVGYGVQKKATLTGAVSSVAGEDLSKRVVASMSTALQGKMPGVVIQQGSGEPGADGASINIRGVGSANAGTGPLVLVDGIETDMNKVDMSSVESVSVLKDAASASIYGSRSSNGVILITTKRGTEGKLKVSYSTALTVQRPMEMPKVVSSADYLRGELNSWINSKKVMTPADLQAREDLILEHTLYQPDNWNRYDTDWKDATVAKSSFMQSHNANMVGGSKDLKYFGSFNYLDQGGLIANDNYNRFNIRVNTDATLLPWLKVNNEISYVRGKKIVPGIHSPKGIINRAMYMLPTLSAVKELDGYWGYGKNGDNPTAAAEASGTRTSVTPEIVLGTTFIINPIKDLEVRAHYNYRNVETRSTNITMPYETSLRGVVNGQYPALDGVSEGWSQTTVNLYRLQGLYSKKIGKHTAKILFGSEGTDVTNKGFSASRTGFEFDLYNLTSGDPSTANNAGSAFHYSLRSYYGRINYEFDDKYLLELSARHDGSSRLVNKRWTFFPSVSAGWIISKENFMEGTKSVLDHLKLRASYGNLGNQAIIDGNGNPITYPFATLLNTGYGYWFDKDISAGITQTTLANPEITWEKSRQFNVGVDAYMLNQRLSFSFDFYNKEIHDMLLTIPAPYYVGMDASATNVGTMRNRGYEIAIGYKHKVGEFDLGATVLFSDNVNTITDNKGSTADRLREGYAIGSYYGYLTDGYFQDDADIANSAVLSGATRPGFLKYKKLNPTGDAVTDKQIGLSDRTYLGNPFPRYEFGVTLTAAWRNFDFTAFIQGVGKRDVLLTGIGVRPFFSGSNLFEHQLDTWTEDNRNAKYPILLPEANSADNFAASDHWVKSGSYARLKNMVIGYTLPKSFINKISLSDVRVNLSAQNLFTLSSFYEGYDPETNYGGTYGGEFYPVMQTFTFGLEIKF